MVVWKMSLLQDSKRTVGLGPSPPPPNDFVPEVLPFFGPIQVRDWHCLTLN